MIVDLHNHAELSRNTTAKLQDYLRRARELGVGVAITEHNRLYRRGGEIAGVSVFLGMEILNDYGDFLVFGAPEDCVAFRNIFALIDYVHRSGGVIIAAHPFAGHGVFRAVDSEMGHRIIAQVDAVEVLNGRASAEANARAWQVAAAHGKPGVGGSDAHSSEEMFRAATRFARPIRTLGDLVQEIARARCGPVRLEGKGA